MAIYFTILKIGSVKLCECLSEQISERKIECVCVSFTVDRTIVHVCNTHIIYNNVLLLYIVVVLNVHVHVCIIFHYTTHNSYYSNNTGNYGHVLLYNMI